jgi:hypothetical protein
VLYIPANDEGAKYQGIQAFKATGSYLMTQYNDGGVICLDYLEIHDDLTVACERIYNRHVSKYIQVTILS